MKGKREAKGDFFGWIPADHRRGGRKKEREREGELSKKKSNEHENFQK
jgi:hypothetical protein